MMSVDEIEGVHHCTLVLSVIWRTDNLMFGGETSMNSLEIRRIEYTKTLQCCTVTVQTKALTLYNL